MFFHAGGNGKNVGVENDILRIESQPVQLIFYKPGDKFLLFVLLYLPVLFHQKPLQLLKRHNFYR